MSHQCASSPNVFCYVSGEFTTKSQSENVTPTIKKAYELYFNSKVDKDKSFALKYCCSGCSRNLRGWLNGTRPSMPFAVPMIWTEQKDHLLDCYFCLNKLSGSSSKNKQCIVYPDLPSARRPIKYGDSFPIPTPPGKLTPQEEASSSSPEAGPSTSFTPDSDSEFLESKRKPRLISQSMLNDLVRDLNHT